jgi:hypothetical protein
MEPKSITPVIDNYPNNSAHFLTAKIVAEKNHTDQNKNYSEKKCVHKTETGFCKRSNKQCPMFISNS